MSRNQDPNKAAAKAKTTAKPGDELFEKEPAPLPTGITEAEQAVYDARNDDREDLGLGGPATIAKRVPRKSTVQRFRTGRAPTNDGYWLVLYNGNPTRIAPGKIIDERFYSIKQLEATGVTLDKYDLIEVLG